MAIEYTATKLRYGWWQRRRDRRNGRRDRRKDIVNYRRNKTTKYLGLIKSEMELKLNQELGQYNSARQRQQDAVNRADQAVINQQRVCAELSAQRDKLNQRHGELSSDYIKRASVERQLNQLAQRIIPAEAELMRLKAELKSAQNLLDDLARTYRDNCTTIKVWGDMRSRQYIDILFKKADLVTETTDKPKAAKVVKAKRVKRKGKK